MKSEALRQLIQIARKRMAADEDESLGSKMEAEAEKPSEEEGEKGPDMDSLLNFMKSKAASPSTSKVSAMVANKPGASAAKAKGAHLFKKMPSKE